MSNWKTVSHKKLYSSKFFEVEEEKVELPSGNIHTYDSVIRKPVSMIAPLTNDYEIYLIKQYRYFFKDYIIELCAGHVDDGENTLAAAKRELKEETGLVAKHWEEIGRLESSASVIRSRVHLFLAKDIEETEASPEDCEDIEVIKVPLRDAVDMVMNGQITVVTSMYAILLLDKLIKEGKL